MPNETGRRQLAIVLVGILTLTAGIQALVQEPTLGAHVQPVSADPRWNPWLGCWQLWEEQLDPSSAVDNNEISALLDRTFVCIRPSHFRDGVELTTMVGEKVLVKRVLVADGSRRDMRDVACAGWEQRAWSWDGQRLFTHAELQCDNEGTRRISGLSFLSSAFTWVDIQVVEIGTQQYIEVRRYKPAPAAEQQERLDTNAALGVQLADVLQARREASIPLTLRDVIEASERTNRRVVETLLVETEPRLALDGEALVKLDDAGISGGVIDLLVALSHPDHFVVERRDRGGSWVDRGHGGFSGHHDPIWYNNFYPYYVTPLGYYYWNRGYNPYLLGGLGTPFVAMPASNVDQPSGRVVRDRGYTRVWPRDNGDKTRQATPRGGSASPSGYSQGGSSGGTVTHTGSSGSSSVRPQGGSRTGRQAVPRK